MLIDEQLYELSVNMKGKTKYLGQVSCAFILGSCMMFLYDNYYIKITRSLSQLDMESLKWQRFKTIRR